MMKKRKFGTGGMPSMKESMESGNRVSRQVGAETKKLMPATRSTRPSVGDAIASGNRMSKKNAEDLKAVKKYAKGDVVDSIARALKIGGLEKKDGSYTATSDLSPEDKKKVEKLAQARRPLTSPSRPLREVAEAIIGRKAADVQKEINSIYTASGQKKAAGGTTKAYAKGGKVKRYADGDLVMGGAASDTSGLGLGLGLPKDIGAELSRAATDKELMDANLAAVRAREAASKAKPKPKPKADAPKPKPKAEAPKAKPKPEPEMSVAKEDKEIVVSGKRRPKPELKPTPVKPREDTIAGRRDARVANRAKGISPSGAAIEARNARVAANALGKEKVGLRPDAFKPVGSAINRGVGAINDQMSTQARNMAKLREKNPDIFTRMMRGSEKKAAGGTTKAYAKGGSVTRGDGIAKKGHTKGKMR